MNEIKNRNYEERFKYQIKRAKKYLEDNRTSDSSEPSLAWCIISDLLRINNNYEPMKEMLDLAIRDLEDFYMSGPIDIGARLDLDKAKKILKE